MHGKADGKAEVGAYASMGPPFPITLVGGVNGPQENPEQHWEPQF